VVGLFCGAASGAGIVRGREWSTLHQSPQVCSILVQPTSVIWQFMSRVFICFAVYIFVVFFNLSYKYYDFKKG